MHCPRHWPIWNLCKNGFSSWVFPSLESIMTTKLTLDQAGRVLIPKTLRQELHLGPGDTLELQSEGDEITLRRVRPKALLKKEHGIWVYQGEAFRRFNRRLDRPEPGKPYPRAASMKEFFDTSVLVAAFWGGHRDHSASIKLLGAARKKQSACSMHTLAEVYATMTALPVKPILLPEQVMLFVQEVRDRLTIVSLDEGEYFETIQHAANAGFTSGRVYDALILRCAAKVKAQSIYTWNLKHFQAIAPEHAGQIRTPRLIQPGFLTVDGHLRDCSEAAVATVEFAHGRGQGGPIEIRPHGAREDEFGVGAIPRVGNRSAAAHRRCGSTGLPAVPWRAPGHRGRVPADRGRRPGWRRARSSPRPGEATGGRPRRWPLRPGRWRSIVSRPAGHGGQSPPTALPAPRIAMFRFPGRRPSGA